MKFLSAILLSLGLSVSVWAEDKPEDNPTVQILATAKMTGACGIMNSQFMFQEVTLMPSGNEFLLRYWKTEATRLGMSLEEFISNCGSSVSEYDAMMKRVLSK